jgi:hypothetical protein
MSATTRQSIADAVSTVEGLKGYADRPTIVTPGDAWALVAEINRGPASTFETTWRVAIVLSGDVGTATDQFDSLIPQVCQALQAELFVDSAKPLTIPTEAGSFYGVELIGRSE